MRVFAGTRFYRFKKEDQLEVVRLYGKTLEVDINNINPKQRCIILDEKKFEKKNISVKYLLDNFHALSPDGLIFFNIVKMDNVNDVVVALKRIKDTNSNEPFAVCRQLAVDVFTMIAQNNYHRVNGKLVPDDPIFGISVNQKTCPPQISFKDLLLSHKKEFSLPIAVYLEDKLYQILDTFNNNKFDKTLSNIFDEFITTKFKEAGMDRDYIEKIKKQSSLWVKHDDKESACSYWNLIDADSRGFVTNLRSLLLSNNFMYDFHSCFDILELPDIIDTEEGLLLSPKNRMELSQLLGGKKISQTYIAKYSKEIDFSKIERDYVLATSLDEECFNTYIIGYDAIE